MTSVHCQGNDDGSCVSHQNFQIGYMQCEVFWYCSIYRYINMLQQLFSPTSLKILFKCLLWLLGEHYVNSVWEPRNTFYRKCLMIPLSKHNFLGETLRNWKKTRSVIRRQLQIHTSNFKTAQKDKAKGLLIFQTALYIPGLPAAFFLLFFLFSKLKEISSLVSIKFIWHPCAL